MIKDEMIVEIERMLKKINDLALIKKVYRIVLYIYNKS